MTLRRKLPDSVGARPFNVLLLPRRFVRLILLVSLATLTGPVLAGGGLILKDDVCIITIGFYDAHFTVYQPDTRGSKEFCRDLPDTGKSIFVLDYLHNGLKLVPVDFRIIRDVKSLGQFVRWADVEGMANIEEDSVFYRPPTIEPQGSYQVEYDFPEAGEYIGIVTAGHPTNNKTYNSVFAFSVDKSKYPYWLLYMLVAGLFVYLFRYAYVSMANSDD